jgi:GNAT superfamily N-acetyltransferase
VIIRPFIENERYSLSTAINAVCADCEWMLTQYFMPTSEWIHALTVPECRSHLLLIVEEKKRTIGWCRIFPENCSSLAYCAELGIGLLRDYRNQGIGRRLLLSSLQWVKHQELQQVNLSVSVENKIALHLFYACGFKVREYHKNDILIMSLHARLIN